MIFPPSGSTFGLNIGFSFVGYMVVRVFGTVTVRISKARESGADVVRCSEGSTG